MKYALCLMLILLSFIPSGSKAQEIYCMQPSDSITTVHYKNTFYPKVYSLRVMVSDIVKGGGLNAYRNRKKKFKEYIEGNNIKLVNTTDTRQKAWRRGLFGIHFGRVRQTLYDIQSSNGKEVVAILEYVRDLGVKNVYFTEIIYPDSNEVKQELKENVIARLKEYKAQEAITRVNDVCGKNSLSYLALPPHRAYYIFGQGRTTVSGYYLDGVRIGAGNRIVEDEAWDETFNLNELEEAGVIELKLEHANN